MKTHIREMQPYPEIGGFWPKYTIEFKETLGLRIKI
jgi:hypothetical protein